MRDYEDGYREGWDEAFEAGVVSGKRFELEDVVKFLSTRGVTDILMDELKRGEHRK